MKIKVNDYDGKLGEMGKVYSVDAICIGGRLGTQAYFISPINPEEFCEAQGNDGDWWIVSICEKKIIPEIITALRQLK